MLVYPEIDPVAISLGPLDIRWYGLMYLFGFVRPQRGRDEQQPARRVEAAPGEGHREDRRRAGRERHGLVREAGQPGEADQEPALSKRSSNT